MRVTFLNYCGRLTRKGFISAKLKDAEATMQLFIPKANSKALRYGEIICTLGKSLNSTPVSVYAYP